MLRALDKNRDERFRSAAEMKQAIESAVRGMSGERCKQCGTPLPGTARFCPECGAVLRPTGSFATVHAAVTGHGRDGGRLRLPLPLVGRDEVLARLEGLDREALVLVGEAGVGKSAVVEAWVAREEGRFRKVVVAGADPSGATTPWYPMRRALTQLLSLSERPTREEIDRATAGHPQDRAGLGELFGFGGAASKLPLDVRRRECVAAVLQTLRRSASDAGVRGRRPLRRAVAAHPRLISSACRRDATVLATTTSRRDARRRGRDRAPAAARPDGARRSGAAAGRGRAVGRQSAGHRRGAALGGRRASCRRAMPTSARGSSSWGEPARQLLEAAVVAGGDVHDAGAGAGGLR